MTLLEVVQVDEEQRGLLLVLLAERGRLLQLLVEERAVREPRQRVVERHLSQLRLCLALGGDVEQVALEVERPAVVAEHDDALVAHPDDPAVAGEQPVLDASGSWVACVRACAVRTRSRSSGMESPDEQVASAAHSSTV